MLIAALALVAAACTGQTPPAREPLTELTTTTAAPTTTSTVSDEAVQRLGDVPGRILVLRADSSIVSVRADGSDVITLAAADDEIISRSQPTWSPRGDQVAWTEQTGEDTFQLVIASEDGEVLNRDPAPMLAQYLDWAPDGAGIAFMGNDFFGAMTLAYAEVGSAAEIIDTGAPMYIDWSPDGGVLLTHIEDRFEQLEPPAGDRLPIAADGEFRVGVFTGDEILYSIEDGPIGEVLVAGGPGDPPMPILRFTAPTAIVSHEPSGRIALMSTWNAEAVRFAESPPTDLPALIPERLSVVELATGNVTVVHEGRSVSWSWSPDGSVLLFSTLEFLGDSQKIVWHTWDGAATSRYTAFTPTSLFGNSYLAFFDQHERSTTRWAPDGSAFVYAGGLVDGPAGIWVQPLDGGDPVLIADGINATWSP